MAELARWDYKDTLRQMTEKFNAAISAVVSLQESTGLVNPATAIRLQQLQDNFESELAEFEQEAAEFNQELENTKTNLEQTITEFNQAIEDIKSELSTKITSITAADLNLENVDNTSDLDKPVSNATKQAISTAINGLTPASVQLENVDNTSDLDKPVSTATQKAIDAAKTQAIEQAVDQAVTQAVTQAVEQAVDQAVEQAVEQAVVSAAENLATTEEVDGELDTTNLYDPEVSAPVKQYIEERMTELFSAYTGGTWKPTYNIATDTQLGVIKSGDEVVVNPSTGKLSVSALPNILSRLNTLESEVSRLKNS